MGEEDLDDDSKASEGQLIDSEDCGRDWSEGEVEKSERMSSEEDQEKESMRTILENGQREKVEDSKNEAIEPAKKKSRSKAAGVYWSRGCCGRMCRGTCPLDASSR